MRPFPSASPSSRSLRLSLTRRNAHADRKQKTILSYVIVGWIAFLFTAISLVLVSVAARKTLKHGVDAQGPLAHETKHTTPNESAAASTVAESRRPSVAHEKTVEPQTSV